jgi:DNA-directed RNA polymerase specialized sigma24 family protein
MASRLLPTSAAPEEYECCSSVCVLTQEDAIETDDHSTLTETAFRRLLRWLDDGEESHGARYIEMRRRLVAYFERRGRHGADALVDETFNRIGRTLVTSGAISVKPPARYCYVVARYVFLEDVRRERRLVPFEDGRGEVESDPSDPQQDCWRAEIREQRLRCLEGCLARLKPQERELVIEYYRGAKRQRIERRRQLAARLGISMNALGIRMSRLRDRLEACVRASARHSCPCVATESFPCIHT